MLQKCGEEEGIARTKIGVCKTELLFKKLKMLVLKGFLKLICKIKFNGTCFF